MITKLDVAEVLSLAYKMRECADRIIDVLVPEPDGTEPECPHTKVEDLSTMDDDGQRYRCTLCGIEQSTPFLSEH